MHWYFNVSLAACLNIILLCACSMGHKYYRAAVFEAAPFIGLPIRKIAERNLEQYELAAKKASLEGADIIVFPEAGLFLNSANYASNRTKLIGDLAENIPDPKRGVYNPCDQAEFSDQYILRTLSCMAKKNRIFLVANMIDYKVCNREVYEIDSTTYNCLPKIYCPQDGYYFFSANVVFNGKGELVSRYHKKHLYHDEPEKNPSKCPGNGYFESNFGSFVTFDCFDVVFKDSEDGLKETKAKNLAFTTRWYDSTPYFYFGLMYQKAYAGFNGINVLAANNNVPGNGTVGSGMFSGSSGAILHTHEPDYVSKLLISNVPEQPNYRLIFDELDRKKFILKGNSFQAVGLESNFNFKEECEIKVLGGPKTVEELKHLYRCHSHDINKYVFTKLEKREHNMTLCHGSTCCSMYYKAKSMEEDFYLFISKGPQKLAVFETYKSRTCFLARCKSKSNQCSSFFLKSKTIFEKIRLEANFREKHILPFVADSSVQFTDDEQWSFSKTVPSITYENLNKNKPLLFMALLATIYD